MNSSINYVSIKILAAGKGVVNTNGNINPRNGTNKSPVAGDKALKNHIFAKRRNGNISISDSAIRNALFKNDAERLYPAYYRCDTKELNDRMLSAYSSYVGLMRGYIVADKNSEFDSSKRASPLYISDFIGNQTGEIDIHTCMYSNDEQGNKESNSLFSRDEVDAIQYEASACISIEKLRFISLDPFLGDKAINIKGQLTTETESPLVEENKYRDKLLNNITGISEKHGIEGAGASKVEWFTREGTLGIQRRGIVLNDQAVHAMVLETLDRLRNLTIIKASGYMQVSEIDVDFNDSTHVFRGAFNKYDPTKQEYYNPWVSA